MIRLLSYIVPITKKVESKYSGTLEITWHNGKKHLNTKNANYSYGSLQKILKFGLKKINLNNCNNILILGLGGGSVIDTLLNDFKYKNHITALDIDPVIIDIAKAEFNLSEKKNLKIICADAIDFITHNEKLYDLIIVDLFIDNQVPANFYKLSFWQGIIKSNSSKGSILFNASLNDTKDKHLFEILSHLEKSNYQTQKIDKVNGTNTLLIAERSRL
jgi:predicted membrane-bound spermidine synthase